jgi:periplasmic divalent cation tolerance protein
VSGANELIVVLCTVPDEATAQSLAIGLVDARLAACVNAIPGLKSYYRWKGKIETDSEMQLLIKTRRGRFDELAAWIEEHHPYDVPEIVAVAAECVSDGYLRWTVDETS